MSQFAVLEGCWSRQQHMAGALKIYPMAGGGGGCAVFATEALGSRRRNEGEQLSHSWVSHVLQYSFRRFAMKLAENPGRPIRQNTACPKTS